MITTISTKALRVLLTVTALSVFSTNNNGMLVSAAPPTRKLGKSPKATAPVSTCGEKEKLVQVEINTDGSPEETSWAIYDACSPAGSSAIFDGDFDDDQEYYQSSNEVCVDENGSYTFKISDSKGDGINNFPSRDFECDYSLRFDGDLVVKEIDFNDGSDEVLFGKSLCKEPKASGKTSKGSKKARHLSNKQSKE